MADQIPISGLPASVSAQTTDIFPIVQGGVTKKESIAQVLSLIAPAQNVVYVNAQTGNDSTGNGIAINPYATISHATTAITTNTTNNRFVLFLQGIFSEAAITVKPWVSWFSPVDVATRVSVTGAGNNVTLDASWSGTTAATVGIHNVIFPSPTNINFNLNGVTGSGSAIYFRGGTIVGNVTARGRIAATDSINFTDVDCAGIVSVTDMGGSSFVTSYEANFSLTSTNATNSIFWTSGEDQIYGNVIISETSGQTCIFQATNGSNQGAVSVTGANASYQYDCTTYPNGGFTFATGGQAFPFTKIGLNLVPLTTQTGATYNALPSDHIININHAGVVTVNLTNSAVTGQWFRIKDKSGAAVTNNITIVPGSGNIDGAANFKINTNYGSADFIFDGANWGVY